MENQNNNEYITNNDFMQIIDDLARMESRITVIEDTLKDLQDEDTKSSKVFNKDCIIYGNKKYVCLKYIKKEPCIIINKVRNIGFDICMNEDSICPWALTI